MDLVILLVGWVVAVLVRAGVREGLSLLDVNSRISERAFFRVDLAAAPTRALITSSLMRINCWQQPRAEDCLEHC